MLLVAWTLIQTQILSSVNTVNVVVVGVQAFTFNEGLTIMYEVAEIVNERPIGKKPDVMHFFKGGLFRL